MTYCSQDVVATLKVYQKLWPNFRRHFPSPVTFAGMLELSTAYLPVNNNWNRYLEVSDQTYYDNQVGGGNQIRSDAPLTVLSCDIDTQPN